MTDDETLADMKRYTIICDPKNIILAAHTVGHANDTGTIVQFMNGVTFLARVTKTGGISIRQEDES